jgi:hypothetical protein
MAIASADSATHVQPQRLVERRDARYPRRGVTVLVSVMTVSPSQGTLSALD